MEDLLLQFAGEQVLMLAVGLWIVGFVLAKVPNIPNWIIPICLLILGIAGGLFSFTLDINGALQGVFACGVAVLADQLYKQAKYREEN